MGVNILKYDPTKKVFDKSKTWTYSIRYNFNFSVNVIQINMLNQLRGNDFVLGVVDSIGHRYTDKYGQKHSSGGLTKRAYWPATVSYNAWQKNKYIAVHEFFHTLGLDDIEDPNKKNRLMYHLEENTGQIISDTERGDMMKFILGDIRDMTGSAFTNPNINTEKLLRTFLNDPTNGFKFNKAKFR